MCLVGVGSVAGFGVGSVATSGSVVGSVGSRVGILSKFVIENNLLLKLVRTFSLVLNNNSKLFKKDFFRVVSYLYQNSLINLQNYFACY